MGGEDSNREIGRKVFELDAGSGVKDAKVSSKGEAAKRATRA